LGYDAAMLLANGPGDRREALFGGKGAVTVWNLLGRTHAPPFTAVLSCELDPGGAVGKHHQQQFPEIVLGVEGEGRATVDGTPHPLVPGAVVFLPLGASLEIANLSDAVPLRYLIIKARE
jgi:quercetin dioxygenase-like cupin family protein